jgi:hypothetical protein
VDASTKNIDDMECREGSRRRRPQECPQWRVGIGREYPLTGIRAREKHPGKQCCHVRTQVFPRFFLSPLCLLEKGQNPRVPIQGAVVNLPVGEETRKWKVAKGFVNHANFV